MSAQAALDVVIQLDPADKALARCQADAAMEACVVYFDDTGQAPLELSSGQCQRVLQARQRAGRLLCRAEVESVVQAELGDDRDL